MASLAACPESQLSSLLHRKTNPAPPPPKQNKIKVLFHNTESPKQSLSVAHGHERAPPRALLTPSSLRASPQGRGPGHRCCMAQRPPAAGTQMAGDSRRRGQQESSGAARHRLGRQRATGTDKAARATRCCGPACSSTGSSRLQACSLPVPRGGTGPLHEAPLPQHPLNAFVLFLRKSTLTQSNCGSLLRQWRLLVVLGVMQSLPHLSLGTLNAVPLDTSPTQAVFLLHPCTSPAKLQEIPIIHR